MKRSEFAKYGLRNSTTDVPYQDQTR